MSHKPFGAFSTYEDYASNITNPEVEELGNNAEPIKNYPDAPDDYGCDMQHERAERDCGAR